MIATYLLQLRQHYDRLAFGLQSLLQRSVADDGCRQRAAQAAGNKQLS